MENEQENAEKLYGGGEFCTDYRFALRTDMV